MKKYALLFISLSILGAIYLTFPIKNIDGFVSIENQKFKVNDTTFYPMVLNFIVSLQSNGDEFWATSYKGYYPDSKFCYSTKEESQKKLIADLNLVKDLGFNTIRITSIGEPTIHEKENSLSMSLYTSSSQDTMIALSNDDAYLSYFTAMEELISIVDSLGLKAIILIKNKPEYSCTEYLLKKFCTYFKDNNTIFAIDIYNEPLYFDKPEKEKDEVFKIVKHWRDIIRIYAPNHLVTIGLEGIREVFRWDPNILDVDFISYHPYEYEPEQVRNEIVWYGRYTDKPWIIGETAIPADNDSISYEEQRVFALNTLKQTFNCGGIGYSWWQYKDVDWHKYHANYMGLVNWHDTTLNSKGEQVFGTVKSTANAFKNFNITSNPDSCLCLSNYYNYSQSTAFQLTGKVLDKTNNPIEGAVVLAWNENWSHSYHTITKKDGSFSLLGSYPFYHWMASATKYKTIRADLNPDTAIVMNNMPTIDLGKLNITKLTFID